MCGKALVETEVGCRLVSVSELVPWPANERYLKEAIKLWDEMCASSGVGIWIGPDGYIVAYAYLIFVHFLLTCGRRVTISFPHGNNLPTL